MGTERCTSVNLIHADRMKRFFSLLLCSSLVGPLSAGELEDLQRQLSQGDVGARRAACEALGNLGEQGREASPTLLAALKDSDVQVRAGAAWALGRGGSRTSETISSLMDATADKDWTVRHNAGLSLVKAGEAAVQPLEKALRSDQPWQRFYAADVLVRIDRSKAGLALPVIVSSLASDEAEMQGRAIKAVTLLGPAALSAAPEVMKLVEGADSGLRLAAVDALAAFGSSSSNSAAVLARQLSKEKDGWTRCRIYHALAAVREPMPVVLPALLKGLEDSSDRPMMAACEALAQLGPEALNPVLERVQDRKSLLPAIETIGFMGTGARKALPNLIELSTDTNWVVRVRVVSALGAVGEGDAGAVEALRKAVNDPHESVRAHAETALARLEKPSQAVPR